MSRRKDILFRQEALRRSLERVLRGRMAAELRFTARAAANAYPELDAVIASHALRIGTIFEEFYLKALRTSAQHFDHAAAKAGFEYEVKARKKKPSDNLGNAMRQWARTNAADKVNEITTTTRDRINNTISRGVKESLSDSEIARSIVVNTGGSIASTRALTIARTESHSAAQAGGLMAANDLGVVKTKEWVSGLDDRTRETHSDADGQIVAIDDTFSIGDDELKFPGDPDGSPEEIINCRCVMAYGIDENAVTSDQSTTDTTEED